MLVSKAKSGAQAPRAGAPPRARSAPHAHKTVMVGDVQAGQTANLAELENLTEETLLHELRVRFRMDTIYTYVGEILVTVNPYKWIKGIYDTDKMGLYHNLGDKKALPPHIFALADHAFQNMTTMAKNQVCVISGESGAGKTEAAKLFVKQLVQVSHGVEADGLEQKLIQVNPLLEAFGNAKTGMNDNSSRFGKFVSVKFNREGSIKGALMCDYLLEKSRVVFQNPGEQNFHVFYIFYAGISSADANLYQVGDPAQHRYINANRSALAAIKSKEMAAAHKELMDCIKVVGFSDQQKENLFHLLSGVIHLGDIDFVGDEGARIGNASQVVPIICSQLGIDATALELALTRQLLVVRGEETEREYKRHEAIDCRDATAKALYGRAFSWIVELCNKLLGPKESSMRDDDTAMGILDIFGFESFNKNSFEQLCINLTNEQLQYFFNDHIFAMELAEYAKEGINGKNITYQNNQPLLDLLLQSKPLGLLSILDEESNFPKATDSTMIQKFHQAFEKHKDYVRPRGNEDYFALRHYAGTVTYQAPGFLEKNRDTLAVDVVGALRMSTNDLVRSLFNEDASPATRPKSKLNKDMSTKVMRQSVRVARASLVKKKKKTVAASFKDSLSLLMKELNAAAPHFVRCIKPNLSKASGLFEDELVTQQLRYTGMLETTRIRREGYASRPAFADFIRRYKFLANAGKGKLAETPETCRTILKNAGIEGYQIGKTKVFMRYWHVDELNEKMRPFNEAQIVLAKWYKMYIARKKFRMLKRGQISLDALLRPSPGDPYPEAQEPEPEPEPEPAFKRWFFGCISRKETEKILGNTANGTFLIRVAESRVGYSLSRVHYGCIKHFKIQDKDGAFEVVGNDNKVFSTLEDIVLFHKDHPVSEEDDYLLQPCEGAENYIHLS